MEVTVVVACAVGAGFGLSGLLAVAMARGSQETSLDRGRRRSTQRSASARHLAWRVVPSLVLGALTILLTRWPVAGFLAAIAVGFAPSIARRTATTKVTTRIEAIAVWTELLRDTLSASAGLGEAIVATSSVAPAAIKEPVLRLSDRLASAVPMPAALRSFAAEIDDPCCDMVACALLLAATSRAQRLADLLGALAESIRDEVAMRLRVEASRASARSSVRTVVLFSLLFIVALAVLARSYLAPFGSPLGQLVLAGVGACYAAGVALMLRLVRPMPSVRLLDTGSIGPEGG